MVATVKGIEIAGYGYTGYTAHRDRFCQRRHSKMNAMAQVLFITPQSGGSKCGISLQQPQRYRWTDGQIANIACFYEYSQEIAAPICGFRNTEYLHNADTDRTVSSERVQETSPRKDDLLNVLALRQTLILTLFYSPSDSDGWSKTQKSDSPTDMRAA